MEKAPRKAGGGRPEYSIIVPTYNERLNVSIIVYLNLKHLLDAKFEIIIVDDGNPNGTMLLRATSRKLGLGTAYINGSKHASGDFVVIIDADLLHHVFYTLFPYEEKLKGRSYGCLPDMNDRDPLIVVPGWQ